MIDQHLHKRDRWSSTIYGEVLYWKAYYWGLKRSG